LNIFDPQNRVDLEQKAFGIVSDLAGRLGASMEQTGSSAAPGLVGLGQDVKDVQKDASPVASALRKITKDMSLLDEVAGRTPQLSGLEIGLLASTVAISAAAPALVGVKVVEVLVPSMAALSAAVGISAEYVGKVAVSNGKEVAAVAIQAAAEAEAVLATAERAKAVLPLCVGIATTASAISLLAPVAILELQTRYGVSGAFTNALYVICPTVAVLSAAIAGLACQESNGLASRAAGIGNRRFASSSLVGKTWLSTVEQIDLQCIRDQKKWSSFALGVLPAPIIGLLMPGPVAFKAVVTAAVATAQAAYSIAVAEYQLAQAVEAVALKSRTAAVADVYANQGSRAGSILPFTSALGALCAAASSAAIEALPLVSMVEMQIIISALFPSGAALFAAAASVSKARCEVDARAASVAVSTLASLEIDKRNNAAEEEWNPWEAVKQLIRITVSASSAELRSRYKKVRDLACSCS
jgi:hypothetical protein